MGCWCALMRLVARSQITDYARLIALTSRATPLGFEPRITPPKGAVLPLHHGVIGWPTYDSRRRNGSCNSGGRTTRDFAGNDRRFVTFGNRERLPYNLNLRRVTIRSVLASECQP